MKKYPLKKLSLILCFLLVFSTFVPVFGATASNDYENHWAKTTIQSAMASGISAGYPDGSFKPDNPITRAEFFALVNNAFKFNAASAKVYNDVPMNAWYAPVISRADSAGYITGYPDGGIHPESNITRQEAALIMSKVKSLAPSTMNVTFTDAASIAEWSMPAVRAVAAAKIMNGYPDGSFMPAAQIKRAEALVTVMNSLLYTGQPPQGVPPTSTGDTTYTSGGTYGPETGSTTINGDVMIQATGVTLQNTVITGDLTIAKEVGDGEVTLRSVTVQGMTHVFGGGENSVYLINVTAGTVHVLKDDGPVRIVISGTTAIDEVSVESDVELDGTDMTTGNGINGITVESGADGVNVSLMGVACDSVTIEADDVVLDVDEDSSITDLVVNGENLEVNGEGEITNAEINANGSDFQVEPTNVDVAEDIDEPTITPRSSGGGGGGGGGSSNRPVTGITVMGTGGATTINTDDGTLQMLAAVQPANATNKSVTWSVTNGTGSAVISPDGVLTAKTNGTVSVVATSVSNSSISGSLEITLSNQISSENSITAFSFTSPAATGTINGTTITVGVPVGTDVTNLVATFTNSAGSAVTVGGTPQVSGVTANDFTNPVMYTVTAEDNTVATYTVTVSEVQSDAKEITAFSFTDPAATGTISGTDVTVTVPDGTDLTALVATFTNSAGSSVTVGGTPQVSGVTANDFTNPVEYTVTAADSSTAVYTVTATAAQGAVKEITAFSFMDPAATGTISGTDISVEVPEGTDVTALIATFENTAGTTVTVGGTPQVSGVTANDFTSPVEYTITGPDSSTTVYTVTVTEAAALWEYTVSGTDATIVAYNGPDTGDIEIPSVDADGNTVIAIGNLVFMGKAITGATIPGTVTSIGNHAFRDCTELTSITIPDGVETIGDQAFDGCTALSSIAIPSSVTSLGAGAFNGCSNLSTVAIADGLTTIQDFTFNECWGLTEVTLPASVTSVSASDAFPDQASFALVFTAGEDAVYHYDLDSNTWTKE